MNIPIYRFDDGWTIERLIGWEGVDQIRGATDSYRQFEAWKDNYLLFFGLKDSDGLWRTGIEGEVSSSGVVFDSLRATTSPSSVIEDIPQNREDYWRTFFLDLTDDFAGQNMVDVVSVATGFPDALLEQLAAADLQVEQERLLAQFDEFGPEGLDIPRWQAKKDGLRRRGKQIAELAFTGLLDEEGKPAFEVIREGSPPWSAVIHFVASGDILIFELTRFGWQIRPRRMGSSGPSPIYRVTPGKPSYEEAPTLVEAWQDYVDREIEKDRPKLPYSKLDAWWDARTVPGQSLMPPLEPYRLVGARMPTIYDDDRFVEWMKESL